MNDELQGFDQVFAFSQYGINQLYADRWTDGSFFPTSLKAQDLDEKKTVWLTQAPSLRFFLPSGSGQNTQSGQIGLTLGFKLTEGDHPPTDDDDANVYTFLANTGDPVEVRNKNGEVVLSGGASSPPVIGAVQLTDADQHIFESLLSDTDRDRSLWAVLVNFNDPDNGAGTAVTASVNGSPIEINASEQAFGQIVWNALKAEELQQSHFILAYQVLDIARPNYSAAASGGVIAADAAASSPELSVFQTNLTCGFTDNGQEDGDLDTLNLMLLCNHKPKPTSYEPLKNLVPGKDFPGAFYLAGDLFLKYYLHGKVMPGLAAYVQNLWPNNKSALNINNAVWGPFGPFENKHSIPGAFWWILDARHVMQGRWASDSEVRIDRADFELFFIGKVADLTNTAEAGQLTLRTLGVRNIELDDLNSKGKSEQTKACYESTLTLTFTVDGNDVRDKGKLVTIVHQPPSIGAKYFHSITGKFDYELQGDPKGDGPNPETDAKHYVPPGQDGLTGFESGVLKPHMDDAGECRFTFHDNIDNLQLWVMADLDLSRVILQTHTLGQGDGITALSQRTFLSGCSGYNFKKVQFTKSGDLTMTVSYQGD